MEEIIKTVSSHTGFTIEEIVSYKQTRPICEARQIFMYLSKRLYGKSNLEIAQFLNRTRQNVGWQIANFDQQLRIYKGLRKKVREIEDAIV